MEASKEESVLSHVLQRALEKGEGVPKTELDRVARGESWEAVRTLIQEGELQRGVDSQLYFPSLFAMRRRRENFEPSLAPLNGVISFGVRLLEDDARPNKTATFSEVVSFLLEEFPQVRDELVKRRFGWALFGLEPFVNVTSAKPPLEPGALTFQPDLLRLTTLEDVFAAQDLQRLEEEQKKVLRAFVKAYTQTGKRHSTAIMLGEDRRRDLVLRSLISKHEAELSDTRRVIVTEKGLPRGQHLVAGFSSDEEAPRTAPKRTARKSQRRAPADRLGERSAKRKTKSTWPRQGTMVDRHLVKRYEVFISSTFIDLEEERAKVVQAVLKLGFFPNGMELFPASDDSQRIVIERAIAGCDYYVVIVAGRYGSLSEPNLSYTEEEFDFAVANNVPVLAFIHANPDLIPAGKTDKSDEARRRLEAFREKVRKNRMCDHWLTADQLAGQVTMALTKALNNAPRPGWIRGSMDDHAKEPAEPRRRGRG